MKKIISIVGVFVILITLCACTKKEEDVNLDAALFKSDYEKLNGEVNANGVEYRTVSIDKENPFVYISTADLITKMDNGESFYVYFGDTKCPWCRSVIEKAIESAKANNIDTIYYVNIWDDDHNEILRDKYTISDKGVISKVSDGSEDYQTLLEKFDNVLSDYTLSYTNSKGKTVSKSVGEKRIYAPNYIKVENGVAIKLVTGNSDKQTESNQELSDEILEDELNIFNEFFKN